MGFNKGRWMDDLKISMERVNTARPIIERLMNGGRIVPVEGNDNEVCKLLDLTCGTDYFQVYDDRGLVWGVASRFQQMDKAWNSFTVRKERNSGRKTEWEKRKDAIRNGGIYPYLTMQAYVDKDESIMSLAIVKTTDIIDFIDRGLAEERHTGSDQIGQAAFYVCWWNDMIREGYRVLLYDREDEKAMREVG